MNSITDWRIAPRRTSRRHYANWRIGTVAELLEAWPKCWSTKRNSHRNCSAHRSTTLDHQLTCSTSIWMATSVSPDRVRTAAHPVRPPWDLNMSSPHLDLWTIRSFGGLRPGQNHKNLSMATRLSWRYAAEPPHHHNKTKRPRVLVNFQLQKRIRATVKLSGCTSLDWGCAVNGALFRARELLLSKFWARLRAWRSTKKGPQLLVSDNAMA